MLRNAEIGVRDKTRGELVKVIELDGDGSAVRQRWCTAVGNFNYQCQRADCLAIELRCIGHREFAGGGIDLKSRCAAATDDAVGQRLARIGITGKDRPDYGAHRAVLIG